MLKWIFRLWHESKLEAQKKIADRKNRCRHRIKINIRIYNNEEIHLRCLGPCGHRGNHSGSWHYDSDDFVKNWTDKESSLMDGRYDD